jgi:cell division protein FtsL
MLKLGLFSLTVAILAACGVYALKYQVHDLEKKLVRVERMIERERIAIRRLDAEWATLSHPSRLARLAERHLKLQPAAPRQIAKIADIPMRDGLGRGDGPALVSSIAPSGEGRAASSAAAIRR